MSLDLPKKDKMVKTPPAKKEGFHFSGYGVYFNEYIEADTLQEAMHIYHTTKRLINPPEQSTVPPAPVEEEKAVE
jgi:hypothetical protein